MTSWNYDPMCKKGDGLRQEQRYYRCDGCGNSQISSDGFPVLNEL